MSEQIRIKAPGIKLIWLYSGLALFGASVSLVFALKAPFLLQWYTYFLLMPFMLSFFIRREAQKVRATIEENPDLFLPLSPGSMNAPFAIVGIGCFISVAATVAAVLSH